MNKFFGKKNEQKLTFVCIFAKNVLILHRFMHKIVYDIRKV